MMKDIAENIKKRLWFEIHDHVDGPKLHTMYANNRDPNETERSRHRIELLLIEQAVEEP